MFSFHFHSHSSVSRFLNFFFFNQWGFPSPFGSALCFLAVKQRVLISWSECLWKVTWKPPFHFSLLQFFQQASTFRSNPLQSVPFDIQSWLLRGLNFLIRWVFVSASSTHHSQSPQLGADRLCPSGCCGSTKVDSFTFFTLLGDQFYTFMSSISFRRINLHVTSMQDSISLMVGSLNQTKPLLVKKTACQEISNHESWWLLPALARA